MEILGIHLLFTTQLSILAALIISSLPPIQNRQLADIIVETKDGSLKGLRRTIDVGIKGQTTIVDEFLGIPFAEPPTGGLRFKPPILVKPWRYVRDATKLGAVCPQTPSTPDNVTNLDKQDEDCLFLNIYSPYEPDAPSKVYPVMFFIHGGSYEYGSGNRYNGSALVQYGVVLVSINYRLGPLGFLSSNSSELPGNYGLLDQIFALEWVKRNIQSFRGDPDNISVFGSSAGGASVGLLMMSSKATGLFHKVIAQSGTANAMWATFDPNHVNNLADRFRKITLKLDCCFETIEESVECLRKKPVSQLRLIYICEFITCLGVDPPMKPVVDHDVIMATPDELIKRGGFPKMPYMTGTVRAEFGDYYGDLFNKTQMEGEVNAFIQDMYGMPASKAIHFQYTDWNVSRAEDQKNSQFIKEHYKFAEVLTDLGLVAPTSAMASELAKFNSDVYTYYLDHHISYHSVELNYVFGVPFIGGCVDEIGILKDFNENDKDMSSLFMEMWSNFAKSGNPTTETTSTKLGVRWKPTKFGTTDYLHMDSRENGIDAHMGVRFKSNEVALWNVLVPDMASQCRYCQSTTRCDVSKTWIFFGLTICLLVTVIILLCAIVWTHRNGKRYGLLRRNSSSLRNPQCNLVL